jgi:hypothetical protein
MLNVLLFLGLVASTPGDVQKNDQIVKSYLDFMKLSFVCEDEKIYEVRMGTARRAIMKADPDTSYKVKDVSALDKALRHGTVTTDKPIAKQDCKGLLKDAEADIEQLKD